MLKNKIIAENSSGSATTEPKERSSLYHQGKIKKFKTPYALIDYFERHSNSFSPTNVATIFYRLADRPNLKAFLVEKANILDQFFEKTIQDIGTFNRQDLAMIAWALVKIAPHHERLIPAVAKQTINIIENFNPQDLVMTAWAFCGLEGSDIQLFNAIKGQTLKTIEKFKPQDLAMIAEVFAKQGTVSNAIIFSKYKNEFNEISHLFVNPDATGERLRFKGAITEAQIQSLNVPKDLIALLLGYHRVDCKALFDAIAERTIPVISDCSPKDLIMITRSYLTLGIKHERLFGGIRDHILYNYEKLDTTQLTALDSIFTRYDSLSTPNTEK